MQNAETSAYKPAYKKNPKTAQKLAKINTAPLPLDLAEVVSIWRQLPEHIKTAIKALIQAYEAEKK